MDQEPHTRRRPQPLRYADVLRKCDANVRTGSEDVMGRSLRFHLIGESDYTLEALTPSTPTCSTTFASDARAGVPTNERPASSRSG